MRGRQAVEPAAPLHLTHREARAMRVRRNLAMVAAVTLTLLGAGARADVVPGDKITDQNMATAKALISPGLEWCVKRGFPLTIVEPRRIEWPKAYKEATEKYSAQVKLAPDGLSVQNRSEEHTSELQSR